MEGEADDPHVRPERELTLVALTASLKAYRLGREDPGSQPSSGGDRAGAGKRSTRCINLPTEPLEALVTY